MNKFMTNYFKDLLMMFRRFKNLRNLNKYKRKIKVNIYNYVTG